jgi:hypothetical protein
MKGAFMLAAPLMLFGCNQAAHEQVVEELNQKIEQLSLVSAEKDSLLGEVVENSRLLGDIGAELAKVKDRKGNVEVVSPESGPMTSREVLLGKIKDLASRVDESEARLRASQSKIRSLTKGADSMAFDISGFQNIIETQRLTIQSLVVQVDELEQQNIQLAEEKQVLADSNLVLLDTVQTLNVKDKTVYYVIGTKKELIEKGVATEEGSKFLFFGGKSLQPARNLADSLFTSADKRELTQITFPLPDKNYKIISRQNLAYLATPIEKDAKVKGGIEIASVEEFWAPSKYLIIVED